jgi:hypothetical protein
MVQGDTALAERVANIEVIGDTPARVADEATVEISGKLGVKGRFVGMDDSAPPERSATSSGSLTS